MLDSLLPVLAREWHGNTVGTYAVAAVVCIGVFVLLKILLPMFMRSIVRIGKRMNLRMHDEVVLSILNFPNILWAALSMSLALRVLNLPVKAEYFLQIFALVIVVAMSVVILQRLLEHLIAFHMPGRSESGQAPAILKFTLALVLWLLAVLLILSNVGVNVVSLLAGLGIGGIAVALAVQNILGDIFSSFSLYMDRPFREGDFIQLGEYMGTVKNVGIKTTRIESLSGEEIIVPNQELTTTRIRNYKKLKERRVAFRFGVTYNTTPEQLKAIQAVLKTIITGVQHARYGRAHFASFGASSLDFEVVYYFTDPDYDAYMDAQQRINLELMEHMRALGVEFAFPTTTVIMSEKGKAL